MNLIDYIFITVSFFFSTWYVMTRSYSDIAAVAFAFDTHGCKPVKKYERYYGCIEMQGARDSSAANDCEYLLSYLTALICAFQCLAVGLVYLATMQRAYD